MIKIENVEVVGWEAAIRGMRNPMNSWEKSDSQYGCDGVEFESGCSDCDNPFCVGNEKYWVGKKDFALMKKLCEAGTDHRKFMRMIVVYVDVVAPLYWWKEFDTYKVGTVRNSCSTMHKLIDKTLTLSDFSIDDFSIDNDYYDMHFKDMMIDVVANCNLLIRMYLATKEKKYWGGLIQILPSSYNQRATLMLNYEVLRNIYHSRKNHKLKEWHLFCNWIKSLPCSTLITGGDTE